MKDEAFGNKGAWIFLSHSHKDLVEVRRIRDELETQGHNPLIFFLKCLEDDGSDLPDLLRREIGARTWFILCDSPNSRASKWVQQEVQMIKTMEGKVFESIDLGGDFQNQLHKIIRLSKRASVFLSYARHDLPVAKRIAETLKQADYRVLDGEDLNPELNIGDTLLFQIDEAIAMGFVLVLMSPHSVTSEWCKFETEYALRKAQASRVSNVVPVLIKDRTAVLASLPPTLKTLQHFDLTSGDFDERMRELIRNLKTIEME